MYQRQNPKNSPKTSWGGVADWYSDLLETQKDTYQNTVILPNLIRLMDIKKGEKVLDLACGQGFFSKEFAKQGAKVTGVDAAPELIDIANSTNLVPGVSYEVSAAHELDFLDQASFDKAVIVLAIQNMHNPHEVLAACARVLKKQGSAYLVINHPAYRVPKASSWGYDEQEQIQYRRVDRYLSEHKIKISMHPGAEPGAVTYSYHRPMQSFFKWFNKSGFAVKNVEEWISDRASDSGPRAEAENDARKEIPLFMYLEAIKL
ncbi:MAG: class I SAM-dependent methyltransferase [Patescibacteria group bacterium]|nr:class I SAM-dependent methyltransferase [Patescibacteria group bacterium]